MKEYKYYFEKNKKSIPLERKTALRLISIKGKCHSCPLCTRRYSPINANGEVAHTTFYDCNKLGITPMDCFDNIERHIIIRN